MAKRKTVGEYELGESWPCECGAQHALSGAYLAAHWHDSLVHTCDVCGAKHGIEAGHVTLIKAGRKLEAADA